MSSVRVPSSSRTTAAQPQFCAGHFYLTQLLIPLLLSGASHSPDGRARVINTSSMGHTMVSDIDFDTLREHAKRKKFGTYRLHYQSKFVRTPASYVGVAMGLRLPLLLRQWWCFPMSCSEDTATKESYRPLSIRGTFGRGCSEPCQGLQGN